jgi:hypothetical protein
LKNYKYALTKKKVAGESVNYLTQFNEIVSARVNEDRADWEKWTLEDL